jgi:hypothetical protein
MYLSNDLESVSTALLLDEVFKRFDVAAFVGAKSLELDGGKAEIQFAMCGMKCAVVGLLGTLKTALEADLVSGLRDGRRLE